MRKTLASYLNESDYLVHADMFNTARFPTEARVIDVGLGESNLLNIASGIASQGETVYVYGVAGFVIHHLQQLKLNVKHFGSLYGKIVICNAGKVGYESMGIGHRLDDDEGIMSLYDIPFFAPDSVLGFGISLDAIRAEDVGVFYIQLGRDE